MSFLSRRSTSSVHEGLRLETASTGEWQKGQLFPSFQPSLGESFRGHLIAALAGSAWLTADGEVQLPEAFASVSSNRELLLAVSWLGAAAALLSS